MATQIQWRRGTTAQTASFTGVVGEATVDTSKNTLVIHDGTTAGGFPLARESALSANAIYLQASYNQANASFIAANSAGVYANGAFVSSNTIQTYVTSANANISLLFSYVNTANANITAAFAAANAATATDATQNTSITASFTAANSAGVYANGAFAAANNAATSTGNYANAAFLTANSATNTATAAYTRANNSINANTGGTITGDLTVTGNLTISGITTYANTQQLLVGDNLITLNADLPTSVAPLENSGFEVNRGNTFANASFLWVESSGKWQANNGTATGAYFIANEANTTSAGIYANGAFTQANTANTRAYSTVLKSGDTITGQLNVAYSAASTSNITGSIIVSGGIGVQGNVSSTNEFVLNDVVAGLKDGPVLGGATNPIIAAIGNTDQYIQTYTINYANTANASADFVAYPNNGNDSNGWIDMGITSNVYACTAYSITGRNEGYLFMSAPGGSGTSGNLVIATDSTGIYNTIEFVTNGFTKGKTNSNVKITSATSSSSNSTGSLQVIGGAGITGNVYADAVYINNVIAATIGDALALSIALG